MGCLAEITVLELRAGKLSPAEVASVDEHVASCPSCRERVAKGTGDAVAVTLAAGTADIGTSDTVAGPRTDVALLATAASAAPASSGSPRVGDGMKRGATLGRYVILDVLGQGGMGVVYAAFDPELDRKVAVKLLRPDMGGGEAAATRLLREGRAIAKLAHPNVVTVFDVGTHDGAVFVAMELVDGRSLDHWIDEEARPWREVVSVFLQAGAGLIAAHEAGMVHRDFKPANVLLGKDGRARVTDFGLARFGAADGESKRSSVENLVASSGDAQLTHTGAVLGTPAYMAPEQYLANPVDERTDQFSFAVALYEALYRERPFAGTTLGELFANVESETMRPAPAGSTVPPWLRSVVLRGLRAKPEDRYPTLAALLDDLRRDPAIKRRRVALAGGGAAMLGVSVIGIVIAMRPAAPSCKVSDRALAGAWDAERKAAIAAAFGTVKAQYARDALAATTRTLDAYAAAWTAMQVDACEAHNVRHEQTAEQQGLRTVCLEERKHELRAVTMLLATADETMIRKAHDVVASLRPVNECADLRALTQKVPPPRDALTRARVDDLRGRIASARALSDAGKYDDALAAAKPIALEAGTTGYRPLHAEALFLAGAVAERAGDAKTAEQYLTQAIQAAEAGRDDRTTANAWIQRARVVGLGLARPVDALEDLGHASAVLERMGGDPLEEAALEGFRGAVLAEQGAFDQALAASQQALEIRRRLLPADHLDIASSLTDVGLRMENLGRYEESLKAQQESLAMRERALGANHPEVAASLQNLGNSQFNLGDMVAAEASYRRSLAVREQALGPEHPEVAVVLSNIGTLLRVQAKFEDARAAFDRALAINTKVYGPKHPKVATAMHNIGALLMVQNKHADAIEVLQKGLAITLDARGEVHLETAGFYGTLSQAQSGTRDFTAALASAQKALAIDVKLLGPTHPDVASDHGRIGEVHLHANRPAEALVEFEKNLAITEARVGKEHPDIAITLSNIGTCLGMLQRHADAVAIYERGLAIDERSLGSDHPDLAYSLLGLGDAYIKVKRFPDAIAVLERALTLRGATQRVSTYANTQLSLGRVLWERGARKERARARKLVEEARDRFASLGHDDGLYRANSWLKAH